MSVQTEQALEKRLIEKLQNQSYKYYNNIKNYNDLLLNLHTMLSNHNMETLKGSGLTDSEFRRVLAQIENKSIIDSSKILRDKIIIQRDSGEDVYIELMNTKKWCANQYQVINQLNMSGIKNQRYDVTILINGLPLVHIELKKQGRGAKKAFDQIENYKKSSMHNLFNFTQLFIISNGEITKYLSNNKKLNYNFTFYWSDNENNKISNLSDFTDTFLEKCHLSEMIARYMVVEEKNKELKVLRPYQVYAVKSIINRAKETNNNGYVWHTTGSGKTLTSFKVAQILKHDPEVNAKKIIFLVDRKDLDSQTCEEFKQFGGDDFLDYTNSSKRLLKQLQSNLVENKMIITTIQKMDRLINNDKNLDLLNEYGKAKVIFIIDECHRSQYGKMHANIKRFFKNAQYFGFTGTPLLIDNQTVGEKLTDDNFTKCLHKYLVKDAIADNNVLGFNVDYYNIATTEIKSKSSDEEKNKISYANPKRIEKIVEIILEKHKHLTHNNKYCGILTVQNIDTLIKYYDTFKKLNNDKDFKYSAIFSLNSASDQDGEKLKVHEDAFDMILEDYNMNFEKSYNRDSYSLLFANICKKIKNAEINLVIVVDMLLTGFDSKKLNTLYVDKNLKFHNLVQAYSRTNRIDEKIKEHGNIICFRDLKQNTDEAIKLFSSTSSLENVIIKKYSEQLEEFKKLVLKVNEFGTIKDIHKIQSEKEKSDFLESSKNMFKKLNTLQTFTEFDFNDVDLNIDEVIESEDFKVEMSKIGYSDLKKLLNNDLEKVNRKAREFKVEKLKSIYIEFAQEMLKVKDEEDENTVEDFDFELELIHTDKINVDYIFNLIGDAFNDEDNFVKKLNSLEITKKEIEKSNIKNKEVITDFIDNHCRKIVQTGNLDEFDVNQEYKLYIDTKIQEEINVFAMEKNIDVKSLEKIIKQYNFTEILDTSILSEGLRDRGLKFKEIREMKKIAKSFVEKIIQKYFVS